MIDGQQAIERINEKFAEAVRGTGSFRDQHWVEIDAERLVEICNWLHDAPVNSYDVLLDVTAIHWPDDPQPMELIYHLYSSEHNDRLRLKARTGEVGPVPSLADIWKAADWNERETYDMFGITFDGHPDLRRILMPDEYTDFPLRKEFPLYRG